MAGTLNIALTQQFDIDGSPLAGAQLFFFQVGTVATLQDSFQDFGLTIPNTNPLIADQFGRIPMFYLADGQVHVRLTDASGVVIFDYPTMQVIGPSSGGGGGGGGSVDPTTIAATGDFKWRATTESLTGWVKANAQTIGNATSGASQRANADTQALFTYLWTNFTDAHCPVVGGRGSTAGADFSASKQITAPDLRSRSPFGLDDMGGAASGRLLASNVTSGGGDGVTTPAATGGESNHTLTLAEAPAGQFTFNDAAHQHNVGSQNATIIAGSLGPIIIQQPAGGPGPNNTSTSASGTGASISDHAGSGAHNNMPSFILGTWFVKL
jgi:hypothetical protein